MQEPFIKVCGIQCIREAHDVIREGANTIGLLVGITHVAEDRISEATAKEIVAAVPRSIRTVMVTHLLDADAIVAIAETIGVSAIQVHDDLPIEGLRHIRKELPGIELLKAVHVTGEDAIEKAREYAKEVDMLLLDSRTKDRLGGTGRTHDWSISRRIVETVDVPVVLAGGLSPDNVERAIEEVHPAGIDANSGLEYENGKKDAQKVRRFVAAGRMCSPIKGQSGNRRLAR